LQARLAWPRAHVPKLIALRARLLLRSS
jgi:hypothetical protein